MKNQERNVLIVSIVLLLTLIGYLVSQPPRVVEVPVEVPVNVPVKVPVEVPVNAPEYRNAPIKQYKPQKTQQMGILLGENDETLPLYGKEVRGRRDRYHYYTTTPGEQIYSLPITHDGRDCMDDIGCSEFYGNESVNVMGKNSPFQAKLYRTEHFF